jgi:hypothetical protein
MGNATTPGTMEYRPLDGSRNEIRLLTIFPSNHVSSSPIRCGLEYVSLDDLKDDSTTQGLPSNDTGFKVDRLKDAKTLLHPTILPLAVRPFVVYLLLRVCITVLTYSWTRSCLHLFNWALLVQNSRSMRRRIVTLHCAVPQAHKLHDIYDAISALAILSHYCLLRAGAMLGPVLLTLQHPPKRLAWIVTRLYSMRECYAQELHHVYFHTVPDPSTFRFVWGDYVALSYAWGTQDPKTMRDIIVNDTIIKVGENLEAALRELRNSAEVSSGLKLWVDSLSINQNDLEERSQQVKRMRDIYAGAWTIMVWLGAADAASNKAMDLITILSLHSASLEDATELTSPSRRNLKGGRFKALLHFLRRPYWRRMWVIQELAMGHYCIPVICGKRRIFWGQLHDAAQLLGAMYANLRTDLNQQLGPEMSSELSDLLWHTRQLQALQCKKVPGISSDIFYRSIRLSQGAMATDSRDKVYGQLGLLPNAVSSRITPDYSLEVRHIYVNFAKTVIQATGNLKVILLGNRQNPDKTWPSWVPDLRLGFDQDHVLLGFNEPYRASGNTVAAVKFSDNDETLICEGFRIAEAVEPSAEWRSSFEGLSKAYHRKKHHDGEAEAAIIQLMAMFLRLPGRPFLGKEGIDSAMAPASEAPIWKDEHKLQAQRDQAFALVLNEASVKRFWEASSTSPVPYLKDAISQAKHAAEQVALAAEIFASRFPVGVVGDHLIFSHRLVERGDDICILLGCNYPVVLRPEGPFYRVVGECYIYDLKDGETMGWLDSGECVLETFALR